MSSAWQAGTSPAMRCGNPPASKLAIGEIPLLPRWRAAAKSSAPIPMLDTGPSPVMTTRRRMSDRPAGVLRHHVVDGTQVDHLGKVGLRDLDVVLLLDAGEYLDRAQRVRLVVVGERTGLGDLLGLDLQHLGG